MNATDIAQRLVTALEGAALRESGAAAPLVSVNIDVLTHGSAGAVETEVLRKTRTLLFLRATLADGAGAPLATASSVHKLEG